MAYFIIKRLLLLIPILLAVSFIVFFLLRFGPVDPAYAYLTQSQIPPTEEALAQTRIELGLDRPFPEQYLSWLKKAVTMDFGISYVTKRPVLDDVLYYLPVTLKLTGLSMLFIVFFSVPLGVYSALHRDGPWDRGLSLLSFAGVSFPSFWLGFLLIYVLSLKLGWLAPFGISSPSGYVMPVLTLSFMSFAINMRLTRTSVLEHMGARSVVYARARGLSERNVIGKHVLKNSMIPIVTSLGMHFGELLGGAVIVETLFALPGLGRYAVGSIYSHDYPVIQCFMLLMTAVFILVNLAADIIYAWLNPKIRYGEAG